MKTFKVMFMDANGKGLSTQHVRANDSEHAKMKAIAPRSYDRVIVRQKEERKFL